MARVEQSIDVNIPLSAVYNQWTQFEQFPRFMDGVREVRQLDDAHLHWRAQRHGREVEWESEIVEQVPDQYMEWRDTSGPHHRGSIRFEPLGEARTRVRMSMDFDPQATSAGGGSGATDLAERLGQDLERFKHLVETQGHESGAWRGEIHHAQSSAPGAGGMGSRGDAGSEASRATGAGRGERTVGQTPQEAREGASSGHPRWEAWTDESAFGTNTASGEMHGAGSERQGGAYGDGQGGSARRESQREGGHERGHEREQGRDQSRFSRGGAQEWLRNQFPNLNEPMGVMRRMTEEMDQIFERFVGRPIAARFGQGQGGMAGKWMPQVEVVQLADALLVCADLPGIKREDVSVEVLHDRLLLEGERHEESRGATREGYRRSERCYGRFYRMIPLPHGVDPDNAQARMQDGVLEVRIPMPGATRTARKVDIG